MYVVLEAEFVAFVQVLIYAGAITILMIFGIMMTNHQAEQQEPADRCMRSCRPSACVVLFGILFYAIQHAEFASDPAAACRRRQHDGDRQAAVIRNMSFRSSWCRCC